MGRLALRDDAEEQLKLAQQDLQQAELSRTRENTASNAIIRLQSKQLFEEHKGRLHEQEELRMARIEIGNQSTLLVEAQMEIETLRAELEHGQRNASAEQQRQHDSERQKQQDAHKRALDAQEASHAEALRKEEAKNQEAHWRDRDSSWQHLQWYNAQLNLRNNQQEELLVSLPCAASQPVLMRQQYRLCCAQATLIGAERSNGVTVPNDEEHALLVSLPCTARRPVLTHLQHHLCCVQAALVGAQRSNGIDIAHAWAEARTMLDARRQAWVWCGRVRAAASLGCPVLTASAGHPPCTACQQPGL